MTSNGAAGLVQRVLTPSRRTWLRKLLQRRLRRFGYTLLPAAARGAGPPAWDVWNWVGQTANVRTVIDIGANTGPYVSYLNELFHPAAIHAFEPLPSCQVALASLRERIPALTVHQLALADHAGQETFFENGYGPASSLLRVSEHSKVAFPETEREVATTVPVARLDDVLDVSSLERDILIKIDVQGVEDRVILGGHNVFSAATMVLIEMSFMPMYQGQPLFEEVHNLLEGCGLRLAGFKNQIDSVETGQPLFAHCFYRRPDAPGANGR
jgi:FkbM family methyltransferase